MRGAVAAAALLALAATGASAKEPTPPELSGDIMVASFWAPWCKPCLKERPWLEVLRKSLAADARVVVATFNVDEDEGARVYQRLFRGGNLTVPRLVVVDRTLAGLERVGALVDESSDGFVRDVSAAVRAVEAGASPASPSRMWKPFRARARR